MEIECIETHFPSISTKDSVVYVDMKLNTKINEWLYRLLYMLVYIGGVRLNY